MTKVTSLALLGLSFASLITSHAAIAVHAPILDLANLDLPVPAGTANLAAAAKVNLRDVIASRQVSASNLRQRRAIAKARSDANNPVASQGSCPSAHFDNSGKCCRVRNNLDNYRKFGCCLQGEVATTFLGFPFCCTATIAAAAARGGDLTNIQIPNKQRRSIAQADPTLPHELPLPPMTYNPGHRTLLNAELAAKYLLGGGKFEHNGLEYADEHLSAITRGSGVGTRAMSTAQPWVGSYIKNAFADAVQMSPALMQVMVPKMFADSAGEFALSRSYKIRTADLPFIANYLHELHPDFDALYLRSIRLDRETFEVLHNYFPEEHKQRYERFARHLNLSAGASANATRV